MSIYHRTNPFSATIKERRLLSKPGSKKFTHHIVLDLKGSDLSYQVGDSIGIYPLNHPDLVEKSLRAMKATGLEKIQDKEGNFYFFKDWLIKKANLREMSKKFINEILVRLPTSLEKVELEQLLNHSDRELLKNFLSHHEVWDILDKYSKVHFTAQEIVNLLMPLLPRLYSISSSQKSVGSEVHLTVALLNYHSGNQERKGVCSHYICQGAPLIEEKLPIYIQASHGFTLPSSPDTPIIMIGPGTGVAPYRAFMQERSLHSSSQRNWLFFGEWTKEFDYFYEEDWQELHSSNKLKLSLAFSRDQEEKIYVQHRMLEEGEELYQWIKEGAYLYVCGDAKRMAKDVDLALHQIIQKHGQKSEEEARAFVKFLRAEKRYLRDIY